jgi:hypothetical protein
MLRQILHTTKMGSVIPTHEAVPSCFGGLLYLNRSAHKAVRQLLRRGIYVGSDVTSFDDLTGHCSLFRQNLRPKLYFYFGLLPA